MEAASSESKPESADKTTYERGQRVRAIARWAEVGVLERRPLLKVEQAFADRVKRNSGVFFRPIKINHAGSDVVFHREVSYLIDAFDSLPWRVDIAFDSVWKAFELETSEAYDGNITERLRQTADCLDPRLADRLCSNFPVQSCKYLFKRLVSDVLDDSVERGLSNRLSSSTDVQVQSMLSQLRLSYGSDPDDSRRKGSMLLRRIMQGDMLKVGSIEEIRLEPNSRARILISLFLYTMRNERFHGSSFSPFVSSKAKISTYTHPYFAFLASYYLLLSLWMEKRPQVISLDLDGLLKSFDDNLEVASMVFGRHWNR